MMQGVKWTGKKGNCEIRRMREECKEDIQKQKGIAEKEFGERLLMKLTSKTGKGMS